MDAEGQLVAKRRIADSASGFAGLTAMLADAGDTQEAPIPASGVQALRPLSTLNTECDSIDQLGHAVAEAFAAHPDHQIITSFTGLGDVTGARVLAEIGTGSPTPVR